MFSDRSSDEPRVGGPAFTTAYWLDETESAVIVYGTAGDTAANRAAAIALQTAIRVGHGNNVVPVKADTETTDGAMAGRHVVLIGGPTTNAIAKRFAATFPVKFGSGSVAVGDDVYAHEGTAVVAVGLNPLSPKHSTVVLAGLSADATYRVAEQGSFPAAEVCIYPSEGGPRRLVVTKP